MKKNIDEILSGNYDGIQEYDNDLPKWWVYLFWLTIILGVGYAGWYHGGFTNNTFEQLSADMSQIEKDKAAAVARSGGAASSAESLLALVAKQDVLAQGKGVYAARCVVCHGDAGQGLVGPNLTDDHWINGGKITDVQRVVQEGVLTKGMLAWKGVLNPEELNSVVAYVWSLYGTNPPNPKAPDGVQVAR